MGKVKLEDLLRDFLSKPISVQFSGGEKTTGQLQTYSEEGMLLTHGEGVQFIPFNQVLTIREHDPKAAKFSVH